MKRRLGLFKKPSSGAFAFNNALNFDGVNDEVIFTQHTGVDTYSVSCWFNSGNVSTVNLPILGTGTGNNYIRINNANGRVILRAIGGVQIFFTGFTWSNNTQYHLAVSVNALSARVWIDDVESSAGTLTVTASTGQTSQYKQWGRDAGGFGLAKYDESYLWYNYALTDADVTTLYGGGSGYDGSLISNANIWSGSHFDETTGNVTTNEGSSGTMTLTNFPIDDSQWVGH